MARSQVSDPGVFGFTWPLFGIAAAVSVVVVALRCKAVSRRRVWGGGQAIMAVGAMLPLVGQGLWILAISALLVGGTFMVTTMAGLQMARELEPQNPAPLIARMTAAFAVGQIVGPALVRAIGEGPILGFDGIAWTSAAAASLLAATAAWLWREVPSPDVLQKEEL